MKQKIFLALMMPFLFLTGISAQETSKETVSTVADNGPGMVYWVDSVSNFKKVLSPNKFRDNWFISVNAGTFFTFADNGGTADFGEKIQPAAGLSVGKWFAPWGGLRLWGMYGRGFGHTWEPRMDKNYHWSMINGYVDAMFNLHNLFFGYKESRKFQLMALLGVGVEHNFGFDKDPWTVEYKLNTNNNTLAGFRTGLMGSFRLNEKFALNVEASVNCVDDSYDGWIWDNKVDGHVNVLLGLVYRFKNHDGSRQFTFVRHDPHKYDAMNTEINDLRRKAAEMKANPPVTIKHEMVEGKHVTTLISFDKDQTKINKLQEVNVFTAAEALKKMDGDLYIAPMDGESGNDDLFVGRAITIRNTLINVYNLPAGRIFIERNNQLVKSLNPEKDYVVIYIVK